MKTDEKQQIKSALSNYVAMKGSQNKAAASLSDVSPATVTHILNNKWEHISEDMWRNIAQQIGYTGDGWKIVQTHNYKLINRLLTDAHAHSQVYAIAGEGGIGKTVAFREYARRNKNVIWLRCEKYWTQKHLLSIILTNLGYNPGGHTHIELMEEVKARITKRSNVLIIMDQFNKLKDPVKELIIPIYNDCEDKVGMLISGTGHLKVCFSRGLRLDKEGYQEMHSRMGKKIIDIQKPGLEDVVAICHANGIESKAAIKSLWADCDGDLRRVKRLIHALKRDSKHPLQAA